MRATDGLSVCTYDGSLRVRVHVLRVGPLRKSAGPETRIIVGKPSEEERYTRDEGGTTMVVIAGSSFDGLRLVHGISLFAIKCW